MRLAELVQCVECEGDGYFVWILPFFLCLHVSTVFFGTLLSKASGLPNNSQGTLALRKVGLFMVPPRILIHVLGKDNVWVGPSPSLDLAHGLYSVLGSYHSYT